MIFVDEIIIIIVIIIITTTLNIFGSFLTLKVLIRERIYYAKYIGIFLYQTFYFLWSADSK